MGMSFIAAYNKLVGKTVISFWYAWFATTRECLVWLFPGGKWESTPCVQNTYTVNISVAYRIYIEFYFIYQ